MNNGKRLGLAFASLWFPGLGHGVARRRWGMLAWALGAVLVPFCALLLPWMIWSVLAVRAVCAAATFRVLGRPLPAFPAELAPRAVIAGKSPEPPRPPRSRPLWIAAMVIGVVGGGLLHSSFEIVRMPSSSMVPTVLVGDSVLINELTYLVRGPRRGDVAMFERPCVPEQRFLARVVALGGQTVEVRCGQLYVDGTAVPTRLVSADCSYRDRIGGERWETRSCTEYAEADYRIYHSATHAEDPAVRSELDFPRLDDAGGAPPTCQAAFDVEPHAPTSQQPGRIVETVASLDPDACTPQRHYVVPEDHVFVLGDSRSNSFDSRFWGSVPVENLLGTLVGRYRSEQ